MASCWTVAAAGLLSWQVGRASVRTERQWAAPTRGEGQPTGARVVDRSRWEQGSRRDIRCLDHALRSPRLDSRMVKPTTRATGCLFCGNRHGGFKSEEHIIGFTLGNAVRSGLVDEELVIPPGEVCDKCNRRRLSLRDKALSEWPPVSVFRSLAQIGNRRGRLVDAVAGTRWRLDFDPEDRRLFQLRAAASTGPKSGREDVARALCKVAVETHWLDDPDDARCERWDLVAAAAIGGPLPPGLAMALRQPAEVADIDLTPGCDVLVDSYAAELRVACRLWVVGLELMLLIGSSPPPIPNTAWWTVDPETGRLHGPGSMWACFSGRAETALRIPSPGPEPPPGRSSRLPTDQTSTRLYVLAGTAEP